MSRPYREELIERVLGMKGGSGHSSYLVTGGEGSMACLLQVQFEVCDATKCKYAAETFEVIYSRDTILHIDDKKDLFTKFLVSISTLYSFVH